MRDLSRQGAVEDGYFRLTSAAAVGGIPIMISKSTLAGAGSLPTNLNVVSRTSEIEMTAKTG